jgi:trimeric autotransporter adhesin
MKRTLSPPLILTLLLILLGCTTKTTSSVSSIQIIPGNSLLSLNGTRSFTAVALDATGNALNLKNITWASSNPNVASVSAEQDTGLVTALSLGSSQITASANNVISAPVSITVLEATGTLSATGAADLMPVLLLGRRLIAAIGLNPAKFAFPRPPLASDLESAPYGSSSTVAGDTGDTDSDGVPNDATSSFSGTYKRGTQPALTYSGSLRTQDASGTTTDVIGELNALKLEGTLQTGSTGPQAYSYTINGQQTLKNNGTRNDSMTLSTTASVDLIAFGRSSNLEIASNAQFVPDDTTNPLAGGTLNWQDTIKTKLAGATQILIERGEGVHLGPCGQYDSGRIAILDASASLNVLEFGPACGEVQFTRDGSPLEPTLGGINLEANLSLKLGAKANLPVSIMDLAGRNLNTPATWTSSNTAVIGVDQGNLNTIATGSATVSASYKGKSASSNITVNTPILSSIAITPASAAVKYGQTQQFTATASTTTGETFTLQTGNVTWASSVPTVASIATNGLATAQLITNSTSITASAFGKTSSAAVMSVSAPAIATITITPTAASIPVGGTQAFSATAFDTGGIPIPGTIFTWASSAPTVASISVGGLASASATIPGATNITASAGGKTSLPAVLTVTDFTLTSLTPLTASVTRPATTSTAFTATLTPSPGFTGTITYSLEPIPVPGGITLTPPVTPVVFALGTAATPSTLSLTVPVGALSTPLTLVATSNTVPALRRILPITLTVTP